MATVMLVADRHAGEPVVGPDVAERCLRFQDLDGRTLALRYDFTASVARVAATTFAQAPLPLRLCYSGKIYRQEPERGARPREVLQVGAELLGAIRPYFRAHGIEANWEAVEQTGDAMLVTTLCMVCPFDSREKQALLEAEEPEARAAMLIALMQMGSHGMAPEGRPS